jgi:putative serine protease PepD
VRVRKAGGAASGTGWVIDNNGHVVTNAHVVDGATDIRVQLNDRGEEIPVKLIGADVSSDLAVLELPSGQASKVKPLTLAESNDVKVGDLTVAIGYPLGLDRTLTQGVVSGVGRAIKAPNGFSIDKVIQTDAAINPGNSGGPLLNSAGRVVGVNSQIATAGGGGNVGIGFAVPSNTVREVVPRLERGAAIQRPYLGVSTQPSAAGSGAFVVDLVPGGPAEQGGVQKDDVIVGVAGKEVLAPQDISTAIDSRKPGDEVAVQVQRAGATRTLRVRLGTRPATTGTP